MSYIKKRNSILIFGASGFIGSNIASFFENKYSIIRLKIDANFELLKNSIACADIIIHAAGVSRSENESDFFKVNIEFSNRLFLLLSEHKNKRIIYFSSVHYNSDSIYGFSKRYNEYLLRNDILNKHNECICVRTPGVFGPGSRPNYVSVVSTFCYNLANNVASKIIDYDKVIDLIFVGDILRMIESSILKPYSNGFKVIEPKSVQISVGELYSLIHKISIDKNIDLTEDGFIKQIILTFKYYKNNAESKCIIE
jgi:UDP-2-acetamido-2,6-beta-L-arabino-hexul-4-ose reductase